MLEFLNKINTLPKVIADFIDFARLRGFHNDQFSTRVDNLVTFVIVKIY